MLPQSHEIPGTDRHGTKRDGRVKEARDGTPPSNEHYGGGGILPVAREFRVARRGRAAPVPFDLVCNARVGEPRHAVQGGDEHRECPQANVSVRFLRH